MLFYHVSDCKGRYFWDTATREITHRNTRKTHQIRDKHTLKRNISGI